MIVHTKKLGAIGLVTIGDIIGEEALNKSIKYKDRKETTYSSGLSFVLELTPDIWTQLKNVLLAINAKLDYRKLSRLIESSVSKKQSWKQIRKRKGVK